VERREENERCATLGGKGLRDQNPEGVALIVGDLRSWVRPVGQRCEAFS
jgi:hypothetical protein